jgi:hypothetical protein
MILNLRQNKPTRRKVCLYLRHVSQLIKSTTGDVSENYIDSHYECSHFKKSITRKYCHNCTFYKPVDSTGI